VKLRVSIFNHPQDGHDRRIERGFSGPAKYMWTDLGVGGDFHYDNVRGQGLLSQIGLYSQTTARNDASPAPGGNGNLADAYRYVSEAYGGYHFDKLHGVNVDAGNFSCPISGCSAITSLITGRNQPVVRFVEYAVVLQRRARTGFFPPKS